MEKMFSWVMFNYGQEDERVECEHCGHSMGKSAYMNRYSLPLACPMCRTKMHGFKTAEEQLTGEE